MSTTTPSKPQDTRGLAGQTVGDTSICQVSQTELIYRGYEIADLAANATFEEVAHVLLVGHKPSAEELAAVFAVNLVGPHALTRRLAGAMALRGEGTVVAISSDVVDANYPGWGAYAASKAAHDHLMGTLAAELPAVRFLSVDPGEMDTAMHADALPDADPSTLRRPADVARALVSHLASAPSGQRSTLELTP